MSKAIVLNNVDHKNIKVDTRPEANLNVNRALVYATEIGELHKEFPLVFHKNPETGQTQLHAILGLKKDENLFISDDGWQTRFVPALLARGPFSLGYKKENQNNNEQQDPVICIDIDDPRVSTEFGEDVFLPSSSCFVSPSSVEEEAADSPKDALIAFSKAWLSLMALWYWCTLPP